MDILQDERSIKLNHSLRNWRAFTKANYYFDVLKNFDGKNVKVIFKWSASLLHRLTIIYYKP